jgi:hypothetical protein
MSFFPENLKLMSSVGADERDAPAISVRNAAAAVALYAIAWRDRCRLTGEWLRNAYADTGNPPYSIRPYSPQAEQRQPATPPTAPTNKPPKQ